MTKRLTREQVEAADCDLTEGEQIMLVNTALSLYDEVERLQEELKSLRDYARRSPR